MARADWLREELKARGLRVCIPARSTRRRPASHNRRLYKKRCRIENAFARPNDWRAIAMRYTPRRRPLPLRHRLRGRRHRLAAIVKLKRRYFQAPVRAALLPSPGHLAKALRHGTPPPTRVQPDRPKRAVAFQDRDGERPQLHIPLLPRVPRALRRFSWRATDAALLIGARLVRLNVEID